MVYRNVESTPSDGIGPWVGKSSPAWDGMGNRPTVIHRLWISLGKMWMEPCTSWGWPRESPANCGMRESRGGPRPVDDDGERPCRPMPNHPIGRHGSKRVPPWGGMGKSPPAGGMGLLPPRGAMSGHEWSAAGRRHGFMRPGRLPGLGWNGQRFGESARWPVSRVLYPAPKGRRWPFVWDAGCPDASRDQPERRRGNALDPRPSHCGDGGRAAPIRSCSRWGLPCRPRCRVRGALLPHPFTLTCVETPAVCFLWHCP